MLEIIGVVFAIVTAPISIIALVVNWLFHTGFWTAWLIVLVVGVLIGGVRNSD